MTAGNQSAVNYTYDNGNRLTQITQGSSTVSFGYDTANRRTSLTLPNGIVMSYSYDNDSELSGITYTLGSNTLGNLTYTYDLAGRRTSMGGSNAQTALPLAISNTAYNADNQLTQWGTANLYYDANGNMTSDGTNSFVWNARNQLASMDLGAVSFQYDPFGRRTTKTVSGTTTSYLYDGANIAQEISGGSPIANLLSGGVDEIFARTDSNGTANFLTNALGSTLNLTNSSGNSLAQYAYEPFGNTSVTFGSSTNSYEYTGRENDGTGLYFNRARYYNPTTGRFLSEDPSGFRGGINLYAYARNNPISFTDPSGLKPKDNCWFFCSGSGGNGGGPGGGGGNGGGGNGAGSSGGGNSDNGNGGNPFVTGVADGLGVLAVVGDSGKLGAASAIISLANDHSPENLIMTGVGLIPGPDVPIAIGTAAYDGSQFITNQILAPVFNAAPTQNINVDVGNGNLLTIPNPALDDGRNF
jgi:RHS repeat-associated protein